MNAGRLTKTRMASSVLQKLLSRFANPPFRLHNHPLYVSGVLSLLNQRGLLFHETDMVSDQIPVQIMQSLTLRAMAS